MTHSKTVSVHNDIPYLTSANADAERHILDVYAPNQAKSAPILLLIHGGVWKQGHKRVFVEPATRMAELGLIVVCPNYRLSPGIKHPEHVRDIARAFDWVTKNALRHGGDPKKIVVAGHSAGGHLAALMATDEQYLKVHSHSLGDIKGLIGISGVYRITAHESFQHAFGTDETACRLASPIHHVAVRTPPTLLVYADKDIPLMNRQSIDFADTLKGQKRTVKTMEIKNRDHHSIVSEMKNADDPVLKAVVTHIRNVSE